VNFLLNAGQGEFFLGPSARQSAGPAIVHALSSVASLDRRVTLP
jgi:hypothetical protein